MRTITDRRSNPFGMRPPCRQPCSTDVPAVFGYGDANADFHLVGDHPGVHGGVETGVPFTGAEASERLLAVLESVGLIDLDADDLPRPRNLFMSYLHLCCPTGDRDPTDAAYDDLERFFDAELRAIAAHVLLPVGDRAIRHVLETYTAKAAKFEADPGAGHAEEVAGSGFLVIPIREPTTWTDDEAETLRETLVGVLAADYRQTADLTRLNVSDEQYLVR
ncbi:MAG: uracil-DNA glycosylase family protein [Halobacteriales archaeon]